MVWLIVSLSTVFVLAAAVLIASRYCWRFVFTVPADHRDIDKCVPEGGKYKEFRERILGNTKKAVEIPYESVFVTSEDGTKLHGRLYSVRDGAPLMLLFHGYRSFAERDFCECLPWLLERGYNAIIVDQRAHGESGGKCLTLGVKERVDCLAWVNYAEERFGCPVVLYGLSMGASTVLMAAERGLPGCVKGIVADCGYTTPREELRFILKSNGMPAFPLYPLIRLGGMIWGGVDIEKASALEAVKNCRLPVLFFHGEDDPLVPCSMGRANYEACASENKRILTVPEAGHGLSYYKDTPAYVEALDGFLKAVL